MSERFAILHHRLPDGEHWDLMLEGEQALLTWQLPRDPTVPGPWPLPARRIGDHRKAYLTYEGPVSRNRGTVRRVDGGLLEWIERGPAEFVFRLEGSRLVGTFRLTAEQGSEASWSLTPLPTPV
ncbi:MAG: hypothetical protein D6788_06745 [Planctomycetota bacterium]|nr:MAG: hypothetical protein D6788_06745 [Planctomycetota bacterium]